MTTRYRIVMDSPLGERRGTLALTEDGEAISGIFSMLGFDNPVSGHRQGDKLLLQYQMHTLISSLNCTSEFCPASGILTGTAQVGKFRIQLHGTAISEGSHTETVSDQ